MTDTILKDKEKAKVESHRRTFFRDILGSSVPADDIEQLVHSSVSPHDAKKLKALGWPSDYIVKVLL